MGWKTIMKIITMAALALISVLMANTISAQDAIEVDIIKLSPIYLETMNRLDSLRTTPDQAIALLNDALTKITEPFERSNIIFWELPALLCEQKNYRAAFEVLKGGQIEGLFYAFIMGENNFPSYITNFQQFDDFQPFLDENRRLRTEAQKTAKLEYVVQLPKNYSPEKKYPLILIFHGGFGSHIQQTQDWHSPKLESDYITAYLQGDQCAGSFLRSFQRDSVDKIITAYKQIKDKYSIDTTRVFTGSQSAGAHISLKLMLNEMIPIKGMVLVIPTTPPMDSTQIKKAAERGVKLAILAGETDPRISRTKEMVENFSKLGLQNTFKIFPGKGHEFPDKFPEQIDLSLDYINGQ
jgi:acetyl esterase/lipase